MSRSVYSANIGGSVIVSSNQRRSFASTSSSLFGSGAPSRRAISVYNIGANRGKRISSAGGSWNASYASLGGDAGILCNDEKQTMQNLNARLSSYMEKVRSLEKSNRQLEFQIHEFYEKKAPVSTKDLTVYEGNISDCHLQIYAISLHNAKLMLQIDNARLAADDFRIKYESELAIRKGVEADIQGLRKVMDELSLTKRGLESQVTALKEDLVYLHRSHKEELLSLRTGMGGSVTVDLDSTPATDLNKILSNLRIEYETIAEKNRKDVEAWYLEKCHTLNQTMTKTTESVHTQKLEITERRRTLQSLEIDLQSLLTMKDSLERNVYEAEHRYSDQLLHLQDHIVRLEDELSQIKAEMERQSSEYSQLLGVKTRLEMEIATYRRLLDGEERTEIIVTREPEIHTIKKVVTVIEKIVDGKVVSSDIQEVQEEQK
ncbi:keratin, type I cytoskeletal 19 [Callorhinchus milii]|uniref:IF rod domain-containing protein n=1 Tax=Callorhinchus milii TaxID=7868 RepID=A0A4W3K665_CALMI|nr:keratin, type I cytoskeletal 19 [Callorhinchus milii]|eukprot:gi/632981467/ref/XP_007907608.1/ PREDICTED: keratin, type I cytoskeletal 19-like [Callorhinchus milii]